MAAENTDLELAKIELEREKLKLERSKAMWTSISIFIPLLIAALTFAYNGWSQVQQAKNDFILQTAQLVINAETPTGAVHKAQALAALFPDQLPPNFGKFIDPEEFSEPSTARQRALLEWLIKYPERREEILDSWIILFPDDEWAKDLR